jgi:hypothetical protein
VGRVVHEWSSRQSTVESQGSIVKKSTVAAVSTLDSWTLSTLDSRLSTLDYRIRKSPHTPIEQSRT